MNYVNDNPIYFIEMNIQKIIESTNNKRIVVASEKLFHEARRVITANVDANYKFIDLFEIFKSYEEQKIIEKINIESVFKKDNMIAYTFSFVIQQQDKQKSSDECNEIVNKIIDTLSNNNVTVNR